MKSNGITGLWSIPEPQRISLLSRSDSCVTASPPATVVKAFSVSGGKSFLRVNPVNRFAKTTTGLRHENTRDSLIGISPCLDGLIRSEVDRCQPRDLRVLGFGE